MSSTGFVNPTCQFVFPNGVMRADLMSEVGMHLTALGLRQFSDFLNDLGCAHAVDNAIQRRKCKFAHASGSPDESMGLADRRSEASLATSFTMSRETCYRCFWPKALCWCPSIAPMDTRTRFVFLMHPKEFKQEKASTGRLTHLALAQSEIVVGVEFDLHPRVRALLSDPTLYPALLYPGLTARNVSRGELTAGDLAGRRLVVLVLDATWSCARKMLKLSPSLQTLPRVGFDPKTAVSRYVIKQQPQEGCLSTLEATHEMLLALEAAGLDRYPDPGQLVALFHRMQDFQLKCAADPDRPGYRRTPMRPVSERVGAQSRQAGSRRNRFIPR